MRRVLMLAGLLAGLGWSQAHAVAPLAAYGKLPAIEQAVLSPDGKLVALSTTNGEQRTVVIERASDGGDLAEIRAGTTKLRALQWAGDHHLLITFEVHAVAEGVDFGGSEHLGLIDYNVATKSQSVLPKGIDHVMNTVFGPPLTRVIDGRPYAFLHGEYFEPESPQGQEGVFRVDLDKGATTIAVRQLPHSSGVLVDSEGAALAQTTFDPVARQWTLRVWRGGAWATLRTETDDIETPELGGLGRTPGTILLFDRKDNEWVMRELNLDGSETGPPIHTGLAFSLDDSASGRMIGYGERDGDTLAYHFFDPRDQTAWGMVTPLFPGAIVTLAGSSDDHRKVLVRVDSPTAGPAFALVDLDARTARWVGAEYDGLTPADIGPRQAITFKAADGLTLTGYLTLPPGGRTTGLPLVVLPHGGPAARDEPGFDWWAEGLASRGYAVLQVNYRGSDGFGWSFLSAGFGQWGHKMQTDLSDAVRWLAAQGTIDPKRVCIVGASYGGYAALAGATIDTGVYRCAVAVAGVADLRKLVDFGRNRGGEGGVTVERYWLRFMGVSKLDDPALQAISPAAQAAHDTIPVLLIHGEQDYTVPFEQSRIMQDALRAAGKEVTLVPLKSEDHYLSRGETRLQMLTATVDFLAKYNPP
jgi:dipeptidyl aminopeptidase/acylaminoacyl peptidase